MIGTTLSHFKITTKLGEGGMGEVYLAEDLKLKRQVALKILPYEVTGNQERVDRFRREAEILASLNHPNIVTIHSVEEADGVRFLAMELVQGERLSDLISRGGMSLGKIFEIAIPLADALSVAHGRGVIHRDLKPANIMVTDAGLVKVLDFGLSKLGAVEADLNDTTLPTEPLTADGKILGTVPYMSPEQLEGRPLDHRTDIFSLGAILYECATGKRPFGGDNSASLISAILRDTPHDVAAMRDDLPPHLGRVIKHCLEKNPEDRYQTAKDVRNELRHLKEELASGTRSGSVVRAASAPGRRWVKPAVAIGAAAVAIALGFYFLSAPSREPDRATTGIASDRTSALPIADPDARLLFEQGRQYVRRGISRVNLRLAEQTWRQALEIEPDNAFLRGELAWLLAIWQLDYPQKESRQESADLARSARDTDPTLPGPWLAEAQLALLDNDGPAAFEAADRAKQLDPGDVRATILRGKALLVQDKEEEGLAELRRGIDLDGGGIAARFALGNSFLTRGRLDEAAIEFRKVLEYAPDHPNAINNLANTFLISGRYLDAVPLYRRALELQPDDGAATNLGTAYYYLDRMEDAVGAYLEADRINPENVFTKYNLGDAYEKLGDTEEADFWYQEAIDLADRQLATVRQSQLLEMRALAMVKTGRQGEALTALAELIEEFPSSMDSLYTGAQVQALVGDRFRMLEFVERALRAGYPREEFRHAPEFAPFQNDADFMQLLTADLN